MMADTIIRPFGVGYEKKVFDIKFSLFMTYKTEFTF